MRIFLFICSLLYVLPVFAQRDSLRITLTETELNADAIAANAFLDGVAAYHSGNAEAALSSFQKVLTRIVPDFNSTDVTENPNKKSLFANGLLAKTLAAKANVFESTFVPKESFAPLQNALACRELVFEVDQHLSHVGQSQAIDGAEKMIEKTYDLFEKTNDPSILLRIFRFVERSKKIKALNSLRDTQTNQVANVPNELMEDLVKQKIELDQQLQASLAAKSETTDEAYKTARVAFQKAIFQLKNDYPDYYRLRYDESVVTVGELQNRLNDKDEAVVSFFETPDYLYAFVITLNGFRAKRLKKDFPLEDWVMQLRTAIESYDDAKVDKTVACEDYRKVAYQLYQKTIERLAPLPEQLIVMPDGVLSHLPISALLSAEVSGCDFKNYPFLLNQHQISYHYSADLFSRAAYVKHPGYETFVGFSLNTDLSPINHSMSGTIFDADHSKRQNIIKESTGADIIHIAIPASTNNQAGTRFQVDLPKTNALSPQHIYNLKLDADLLVLPHCASGTNYQSFLGIVQGFQYGGVKSVVSSLWRNDAESNNSVMNNFYVQLRNGLTKDGALRHAKLALQKEKDEELAHPVHWATFIPIGDMDAVKEQNWYLYLVGIAPLIAMFYFWRIKLRKKRKKKRKK